MKNSRQLVACHVCESPVARSASACPRCGVQTRAYHAQLVGSVGLFAAFAFGIVASRMRELGEPERAAIFIWLAIACLVGGVGYWVWRRFL